MSTPRKTEERKTQDCAAAAKAATRTEPYAQKLGMRCVEVRPGYCKTEMLVDAGMKNLFGTTHGGAVFSLIDESFQVACNSHGVTAYALNVSVTYVKGSFPGDRLCAEANEIARTRKTATYVIEVRDGTGELVAHAQAVAYRTGAPAPFLSE